jgi:glycosyltransferase involved in cell wall biosynthesis
MGFGNINFEDTQHLLLLIAAATLLISFLVQMYYYLIIFRRVGVRQRKPMVDHIDEPVSVIICVKDESPSLSKILPLVLEQNYPQYEVIVVNDNSSDDTDEVLKIAQNRYPHLQVRNLVANKFIHGKSIVLGVGIKAAKFNRIVITDLACRPSADWLKSLSAGFDSAVVTSYTRYSSASRFVRIANYYESLFRLGYALNKRPYTASGENESFTKELFLTKGFNPLLRRLEKVEQVFFNSVMNKKNTKVVLSANAIVDSEKTLSFDNWSMELSSDLFSRRLFRCFTRHIKLPEIVSRVLFYLCFIVLLVMSIKLMWLWMSIVGVFLLRLMVQMLVFRSTQKTLGENKLLLHTVLWDIYSTFAYMHIVSLIRHRKAISQQ